MQANYFGPANLDEFMRRAMLSPEDNFVRHEATIRLNDGEAEHQVVIELATGDASDHSAHPRKAYWFVPDEQRALSFINELLTDDIRCSLVLSDGREGTFTYAYDGLLLHLHGLTALQLPSQ